MNKRLLLLFTMVFALCCHNAYAITIDKYTKSGQILSTTGEIKKGTVSWDATTKTLSLYNAEIQGTLSISHEDGINIDLNGDNVIGITSSSASVAMSVKSDLMISSTCGGSLKLMSDGASALTLSKYSNLLTVKNCSVEIISKECVVWRYWNYNTDTGLLDIEIDNASFYVHSQNIDKPITGAKSITLKNCELVSPANYAFFDGNGYLYKLNSDKTSDKEIWKGDFQVKPRVALNYDAIMDDPNALYSLTLNSWGMNGDGVNVLAIGLALVEAGVDVNLMYSAPCVVLKNAKPNEVKALAEKLVSFNCSVSIEKTGGVYFKNKNGVTFGLPDGEFSNSMIMGGKVTYDAKKGILTLDNAEIMDVCLYISNKDVTIDLIGQNTIEGNQVLGDQHPGALIMDGANVTIQSSCNGKLVLHNSDDYCLRDLSTDSHTITVKDCDVVLRSMFSPLSGTLNASNPEANLRIVLDHAAFDVDAYSSAENPQVVTGVKDIILKNSIVVEPTPTKFYFKKNDGYIYYKDENRQEKAWLDGFKVRKAELYGINICGVEVSETNYSDVLGDEPYDGIITYDPTENVLTLDNVRFGNILYDSQITFRTREEREFVNYKIKLIGENMIIAGNDMFPVRGIHAEKYCNVIIQGPGSLNIRTQDNMMEWGRFKVEQQANVTINGISFGDQGWITVDGATLCIKDPSCIGSTLSEVSMKNGVTILNEDVYWNASRKYFLTNQGYKVQEPITIGIGDADYQVILSSSKGGANVVLALEELLGITRSEAMDLYKNAPCVLVEACSQKYAEELAKALRAKGATVEVTENSETGIIGTTTTSDIQQPIIYDIQGQQLQSIPSGSARRIYIVNGKKVLR